MTWARLQRMLQARLPRSGTADHRNGHGYGAEQLRGDVFGALTSVVVMLPLSLAFGVASGLGAIAGLYSAVAVGLITALLGGTKAQITGPTAPLSVAMSVVVIDYASDDITKALAIVVFAGVFQILLGALKLGSYVAYTPYPVISGFTSAVGVIIVVVQLIPLLGSAVALGGVRASLGALPDALSDIGTGALMLGLLTIAVYSLWPPLLSKLMPASVAALAVGTFTSLLWIDNVDVIGEVPTGLPDLELPSFGWGDIHTMVAPALTLAILASVNSLLTAMVADSLTQDQHRPNREIVSLGLANVLAAMIGAVPGSGATTATVANIRTGGRTKVSSVLAALVLGALVLGLGRYAEHIPHAVLSGILIKVGIDIIDWKYITRLRRSRYDQYAVMALTLGLSVVTDLIVAVAAGLIAAAMTTARQFERFEFEDLVSTPLLDITFLGPPPVDGAEPVSGQGEPGAAATDPFAARTGLLSLRGVYTAASSIKLFNTINSDVAEHDVVIFDFTDTRHMDDSAAFMVGQLIAVAQAAGAECIVLGLESSRAMSVKELDVLASVPPDQFVDDLDGAREVARRLLDGVAEPG